MPILVVGSNIEPHIPIRTNQE